MKATIIKDETEYMTAKYQGQCPRCKKVYRGLFLSHKGVIPPPIISVTCNCEIPVTPLDMIYWG